ncbi:MAG: 16S rRNA (cytosine(967)-C(5))-methyltransferase RsmB, partial [Kangiellaceae bacterium]|nr:16S rRNA (cytosine(967)-C(5))-methyltransferase RsmB [Kangiellaceae bacterium]
LDHLNQQEKAQAKQLLFGSLRYFHQLKTIAENLFDKPLKAKDQDVLLVVILGLYQLKYMSTPDHAAISESVELVRNLRKNWATGLVNGILRRYQREERELSEQLKKSIQYQYSHPGWLVKKIKADWPEMAESILQQNNIQAPMILRVNTLINSRQDYLAKLHKAGIEATRHKLAKDAILLQSARDVSLLPGFEQGEVTVQDAAPQLAVELMRLNEPDEGNSLNILDGCAAPGGKTGHIIQRAPNAHVVAVESSENRALKIKQTLQRLNLKCEIKNADMTRLDDWWDGMKFDRILLDVPCTASGVIRRNPDIKIHRKITDLKAITELQFEILKQAWQTLKTNGILVYATCSIFKQENQEQIERFIKYLGDSQQKAGAVELPGELASSLNSNAELGYQIFPGEFEMDGFYLCGLKKLG